MVTILCQEHNVLYGCLLQIHHFLEFNLQIRNSQTSFYLLIPHRCSMLATSPYLQFN